MSNDDGTRDDVLLDEEDRIGDPSIELDDDDPQGTQKSPKEGTVDKKRYDDLRAETNRQRNENQRLEREIAEIRGMLMASKREPQAQRDYYSFLQSDDLEEELQSNPAKARELMVQAIQALRTEVAETLDARDKHFMERMGKYARRDADVDAKVQELRESEELSDLPEDVLERIARAQLKKAPKKSVDEEDDDGPLLGGAGRRAVKSKEKPDIRKNPLFQKIYGKKEEIVI